MQQFSVSPFARQTAEGHRAPPRPPTPKTRVHPVADRVDQYRIWVPDFNGYTLSAPGRRGRTRPRKIIETYPVDGQEGRESVGSRRQGPIGRVRVLERTVEPRQGEGAWQLAAELVRLLGERAEAGGEDEASGRLRRGVLFGECLKVVHEWLGHEKIAVLESDLGGDGMRDLARSAILDAMRVAGMPAQKIGVPGDPREELRSAGNWRPFTTGLTEIVSLERSELNVAACHTKLEGDIASVLDESKRVVAFVRNHGPERMEIPYKYKGGWAKYVPDFFVRLLASEGQNASHRP